MLRRREGRRRPWQAAVHSVCPHEVNHSRLLLYDPLAPQYGHRPDRTVVGPFEHTMKETHSTGEARETMAERP